MSVILGLHFGHDSSAAIVKDGKVVANISSERVKGIKKYDGIDEEILDYVLKQAKMSAKNIDSVVLNKYWPNEDSFEVFSFTDLDSVGPDLEMIMPLGKTFVKTRAMFFGRELDAYIVDHHAAHAASSYYLSNFDNAISLTIDACSRGTEPEFNGSIAIGNKNSLKMIGYPENNIAPAYNMITALLELGPPVHKAGTTMGLASYGKVYPEVVKNIDKYVAITHSAIDQDAAFSEIWVELTKEAPRISASKINDPRAYQNSYPIKMYQTKEGRDMAASIQYIFEQSILKTVEQKILPHGIKNLTLAGGSFLNCNANSLIKSSGWFDNIYQVPAQGDDGLAVGAALYLAHHILDEPRKHHSNREVAYSGKNYKVSKFLNYEKVAKFIADGKIVAWANGASEFGPRALGNRSLLADPRNFHNREVLNFVVKSREWFRPFAPSVLEEHAADWFSPGDPSPFMLYTQKVLQPEKVPAITHIDGTARIQTVNKEMNSDYYEVIKEFYKITGVPMVLNTSLNGKGEPIAETKEQIFDLFETNSGIDVLVYNGKIYEK
jgi:carbamoyltransferase